MKPQNLLPLLIIVLFFSSLSLNKINKKVHSASGQDSVITISISAVGDLMCHMDEADYAKVSADSFNFNPYFDSVRKYIEASDFSFANLETVTAGKIARYSGYPRFNSPKDFITAIKNCGFKLISTSNNHALDRGELGILKTIDDLKKNNLNYNGTFVSQSDRDSIRIFNIKGIKTAFLNYTYGTNGNKIPAGKPYLINLIDTSLIHKDIVHAKKDGADVIIVHFHFGQEYKRVPTEYQKKIVEAAVSFGADIIIGAHPHVIEPAEFIKTTDPHFDTGFVAYSLGNFISNQRWRYSDAGIIITIKITKDITRNICFISSVDYLPTWVFKGKINSKNEFEILPAQLAESGRVPYYITTSDSVKMRQAFEDTKSIITKFSNEIYLQNIQAK